MGDEQLFPLSSKGNNSGSEKRRSARYAIDVRVRAEIFTGGRRVTVSGHGGDLSQQGMRVFLPLELEMNATMNLEIMLPYSSQRLILQAVIRNRNSFTYGIEFTDITSVQQIVITRACRALALLQ